MKKILIATDFTPHAERAMQHGFALARLFGADVELLTSRFVSALALGPEAFALPAGWLDDLDARARRELEDLAEPVRAEGLAVSCTVATEPPADALCERARSSGSDLVVLGTHGRHGI